MPFNQNTSQNTVVYTSGQWDSRTVKANDQSVKSSTDYFSAFKINLGKYERFIWRAELHWDYGDGDLKYKITIPAGLPAKGFRLFEEQSELPTSSTINWSSYYHANNTGRAETSFTVGTGEGFFRLQGTVENGGTAGDLDIQFSQRIGDTATTTLKAGSYIEYMRF